MATRPPVQHPAQQHLSLRSQQARTLALQLMTAGSTIGFGSEFHSPKYHYNFNLMGNSLCTCSHCRSHSPRSSSNNHSINHNNNRSSSSNRNRYKRNCWSELGSCSNFLTTDCNSNRIKCCKSSSNSSSGSNFLSSSSSSSNSSNDNINLSHNKDR